jgi:1-phosphofructokinase family hexose kinase
MADAHQLISVCLNPAVDRSIEVDGLVLGEHQTGREVSRVAGGKAVNVTRVLAALDVACLATGFVGESNRLIFDSHLAQPLITEDFVSLPGWTRENITLIDTVAGQETHIRDAGLAITSEAMFALSGKLRSMVTDSSTVVFSGSLPPGVSPAAHAGLIDLCIQAGARVAVDTSGPALAELADRPLWLVKPNAEELVQLVGRPLAGLDDQLAAVGQLRLSRRPNRCLSRVDRGRPRLDRQHRRLRRRPSRSVHRLPPQGERTGRGAQGGRRRRHRRGHDARVGPVRSRPGGPARRSRRHPPRRARVGKTPSPPPTPSARCLGPADRLGCRPWTTTIESGA